jgi:hypothetical protein
MRLMRNCFLSLAFIASFFSHFICIKTFSQQAPLFENNTANDSSKKNVLTLSAYVRVRGEVRHGYRNLPLKDTAAAFFINQRTRLNLDFKSPKFNLYLSLQDGRVWGQQDARGAQGVVSGVTATPTTTFDTYFFEAYAEPRFNDKLSLRIGRQRIMYDNQRLFAENDWRLSANSHDAVRLIFNNQTTLNTELTFAFNQSAENNFTTNYVPYGFNNYKVLFIHYVRWKPSLHLSLSAINVADGYQSSLPNNHSTHVRFTSGGRIEFTKPLWMIAASAYYQYGNDSSGKTLSAYYFQPEIKYTGIKNLSLRLGMEWMSGQQSGSKKDNSFVPLYGTVHAFMGSLDLFGTFPLDVSNGGLINPYLFFQYQAKQFSLSCENHLFYSHTRWPFRSSNQQQRYLGFENDWRFNYSFNNFINLEWGFSWASVSRSMILVKSQSIAEPNYAQYSKWPYWAYVSVKFTPTIGKFSF